MSSCARLHVMLKPRARQQFRRTRRRCVAANRLHPRVQVRQLLAMLRGVGFGCSVSRAMAISSSRNSTSPSSVFERRAIEGRRLLRHMRNHPAIGHRDIPALGVKQPAQGREQGGFASAIGANDPDLAARG